MSRKKLENYNLAESIEALANFQKDQRILAEVKERREREEYDALCGRIAEFVIDLTDLKAKHVTEFLERMGGKEYKRAADIITYEITSSPRASVTRALARDAELKEIEDDKEKKKRDKLAKIKTFVGTIITIDADAKTVVVKGDGKMLFSTFRIKNMAKFVTGARVKVCYVIKDEKLVAVSVKPPEEAPRDSQKAAQPDPKESSQPVQTDPVKQTDTVQVQAGTRG